VLQALSYYGGFVLEGIVPHSALEKDSPMIEAGFYSGQYAVIFSGPWMLKVLNTPSKRWAVRILGGAECGHRRLSSWHQRHAKLFFWLAFSDHAVIKNKEEAWKVLRYLCDKEAQVKFSQLSGMLPARLDAAHDTRLKSDIHYAEFLAQIKNGRHYPSIAAWGALEMVYRKHLGELFHLFAEDASRSTTPQLKQKLETAAREANQVLEQHP